jgi:F-type H+-transporting ATPase subunit b
MNINFTIILEVISFLILVGILTKLIYRPLLRLLDRRNEDVKRMLSEARRAAEQAEKNNQASRENLQVAREEALRIKNVTRQEADRSRLLMIEDAKKEAARILEKAKIELAEQTKLAREALKKDISSISLDIAERILEREIKEDDHKKLIRESLKELVSG